MYIQLCDGQAVTDEAQQLHVGEKTGDIPQFFLVFLTNYMKQTFHVPASLWKIIQLHLLKNSTLVLASGNDDDIDNVSGDHGND